MNGMTSYKPFDRRRNTVLIHDGDTEQVMLSARVARLFKSDVKAYAATHEITVQDMMRDALAEYMQRHQ